MTQPAPSIDEMYAEIMERRNLDPKIRWLFEQLEKNAMKRLEKYCEALVKLEEKVSK